MEMLGVVGAITLTSVSKLKYYFNMPRVGLADYPLPTFTKRDECIYGAAIHRISDPVW